MRPTDHCPDPEPGEVEPECHLCLYYQECMQGAPSLGKWEE
jgi:hypothetical protein